MQNTPVSQVAAFIYILTQPESLWASLNWNLIKNHFHPPTSQRQFERNKFPSFINYVKLLLPFQMSGAAIIGLSVWTLLYKHQYVALLASSNYQFCTYALMLAGIGAVMSAIIGCCGVKRENFAIILIVSSPSWHDFILITVRYNLIAAKLVKDHIELIRYRAHNIHKRHNQFEKSIK